jgi:hypothetical protein
MQVITNDDGDGTYTVRWSVVSEADTYALQEATNESFAQATQLYAGGLTNYGVTGRGAARYFYRVQARNTWGSGPWSNTQWVDVLWEAEPNDAYGQANGPIVSGLTYYGTFPNEADGNDYYFFDLPASHSVEIWLTNVPAANDYALYLYNATYTRIGYSDEYGDANEHIYLGSTAGGRYYIRVERVVGTSQAQPYALRVVFQ